jgi:hypothetical protein
MKFIVDCMLGKLARWLKILGFDVIYFPKIEDSELLALARKERRTLLTRDNMLVKKAKGAKSLFIESDVWKKQVEQVLREFRLWKKAKPYSRCIECNIELKNLSKKKAENLVAPFVWEHASSFALCPQCGRVFWQGTHFQDMEFRIEEILRQKKVRKKKK